MVDEKVIARKRRRSKIIYFLLIFLFVSLLLWLILSNVIFVVSKVNITNSKVPKVFDGYTIVQLSDIHNVCYGQENSLMIAAVKNANPDIIVLTGDLVNYLYTDYSNSVTLLPKLIEIAPVYFVSGNHEIPGTEEEHQNFYQILDEAGVIVLSESSVTLTRGDASIILWGLSESKSSYEVDGKLAQISPDTSHFNILLAHRPEYFSQYAEKGYDLVLSGHTHGGQFIIPFLGGVYSHGQGFFPKYDSGLYGEGSSQMYISRGLGPSVIPFRFNNFPEMVVITLKSN